MKLKIPKLEPLPNMKPLKSFSRSYTSMDFLSQVERIHQSHMIRREHIADLILKKYGKRDKTPIVDIRFMDRDETQCFDTLPKKRICIESTEKEKREIEEIMRAIRQGQDLAKPDYLHDPFAESKRKATNAPVHIISVKRDVGYKNSSKVTLDSKILKKPKALEKEITANVLDPNYIPTSSKKKRAKQAKTTPRCKRKLSLMKSKKTPTSLKKLKTPVHIISVKRDVSYKNSAKVTLDSKTLKKPKALEKEITAKVWDPDYIPTSSKKKRVKQAETTPRCKRKLSLMESKKTPTSLKKLKRSTHKSSSRSLAPTSVIIKKSKQKFSNSMSVKEKKKNCTVFQKRIMPLREVNSEQQHLIPLSHSQISTSSEENSLRVQPQRKCKTKSAIQNLNCSSHHNKENLKVNGNCKLKNCSVILKKLDNSALCAVKSPTNVKQDRTSEILNENATSIYRERTVKYSVIKKHNTEHFSNFSKNSMEKYSLSKTISSETTRTPAKFYTSVKKQLFKITISSTYTDRDLETSTSSRSIKSVVSDSNFSFLNQANSFVTIPNVRNSLRLCHSLPYEKFSHAKKFLSIQR